MTTTLNASVHRDTRFEIREIHQGPNSFGLVCTERGERGRLPPLEVPETAFTAEEMRQVHAVLEMLEAKFEPVYDAHVNDPERLKELLVEAKAAEARLAEVKAATQAAEERHAAATIEAARIEAENLVKRAEAEQLDNDLAAMRAAGIEVAAVEVEKTP